jgi:hypothetical protein
MKNFNSKSNQFKSPMKTKTRKRIHRVIDLTKASIEKVDLSRFFKSEIPKRSKMAAHVKREILIAFEVRDMFRSMSVSTILDEKREASVLKHETFDLNKVNVVDMVSKVEKTVVIPTAYDTVHDRILGTFRKGKNFVKHTMQTVEVVPTIDWNNFSYPPINNIES